MDTPYSGRELQFSAIDALAHTYPRPLVPMLPVLSWARLKLFRQTPQSRFLAPDARYFRSGRVALATALMQLGIGSGDQVLLPAFHCGSMVEPAMWRGAELDFYDIGEDLAVNVDDLKRHLTARTRAVVVTHYFGFPQHISALRAWCDEVGIALIEDCAHAFFGEDEGRALGSTGHYAIASSVKFFPGTEGGALVANARPVTAPAKHSTCKRELKALGNLVETASRYGRLGLLGRLLTRAAGSGNRPPAAATGEAGQSPAARWRWFNPDDIDVELGAVNRSIIRHTDQQALISARRANYARLAAGLAGMRHGKLLFPELPAGVVPYVLPLLIDDPARQFPILKQRALPIWRWDEQILTNSPVSRTYRLHLLQLPVHQELTAAEIEQLIDGFRAVLA